MSQTPVVNESKKRTLPLRDLNGFRVKRALFDSKKLASGDQEQVKTIHEEETEGASYIIDGKFRKVTPYYFTYLTYCKLRWRDRKLIDIFSDEFRLKTREYYERTINDGKVTLNDKVATIDSVMRNGDLMKHRLHRHEPPVSSDPIEVVFEDDEIMVIDKPSGIPAHPTGRYRYNSVTKIIEHEMGKVVHTCNRLDRLTSGLMFLGKTSEGANKLTLKIRLREVSKFYIAKVVGEFPLEEIVCDKPLKTVNPKLCFNQVRDDGKESKTSFKRISFNGETSIVLCRPFTGRTHQIRVHLQYIGYPIANDPIYSSPEIWGPNLGKNGEADVDAVMSKLDLVGKSTSAVSWAFPKVEGEVLLETTCEVCDGELWSDPGPNDLGLWLHLYKYELDDGSWSYKTNLPEWALEDHRPMMELALEQLQKCEPTSTAFCVGAVLVHDNKVLATGYSRELPGNTHLEQCCLDKYYKENNCDKVPKGSVIYTTMEPCSERLSGNLPCCDRILKDGNIQTCFVGVMEPTTFIAKNIGMDKLESNGISYIHVPGYEELSLKLLFKGHEKDE